MPTGVNWARNGVVNSVTVGVEVMWSSVVEGQTKQGSIACSMWSWLYSIVYGAPVNQLHKVNEDSSPPVTVNVAVEPCPSWPLSVLQPHGRSASRPRSSLLHPAPSHSTSAGQWGEETVCITTSDESSHVLKRGVQRLALCFTFTHYLHAYSTHSSPSCYKAC